MDYLTIFLALIAGLSIIIFLFLKPKILIFLLIFFCIFDLGFFSRWFDISRYLARLPFFLSMLLSVRLCADLAFHRFAVSNNLKIIKLVLRFFIFLLAIAVLSILYNEESLGLGLYELRYYLLLVALCLAIYYYKPLPLNEERFIKLLLIIGLIQIPFTAIQYSLVQFFGLRLAQSALDMSSGTFSGYPSLVFFQCIVISITLIYQFRNRRPIFYKLNNYLLILLLIIPLVLSFSRTAMGFVTIIIITISLKQIYSQPNFMYRLRLIVSMVVLTVIVILGFYNFFWKQHGYEQQLSSDYILDYFLREPKLQPNINPLVQGHPVMGRGTAVIEAIRLITTNKATLIGVGSGGVSHALFLNEGGKYFQKYGPLAGVGRTQISKITAELGLIGLAIFIIFFLKVQRQLRIICKNHKEFLIKDIYMMIIITLFMLSFYTPIFAANITILLLAYFLALTQHYMDITKTAIYYENQ